MDKIAEQYLITKEGETLVEILASIRDELKKMNEKKTTKKTNSIFDLLSGGMKGFPQEEEDDDDDDDDEDEEDNNDEEEDNKEEKEAKVVEVS